MKNNRDYPVKSYAEHVALIAGLFSDLDKLLIKIAPEGYQNSPYYYYFKNSRENEYYVYRLHRASVYKRAKREGRAPEYTALVGYEEWVSSVYDPMPAVLPDEPVAMLAYVLFKLETSGAIVDRDCSAFNFKLEDDEYDMMLKDGLNQAGVIVSDEFRWWLYRSHPYRRPDEIDDQEILRFIFEFLLTQGLEFEYRDEYLNFILRLQRELDEKKEGDSMSECEMVANFLRLDEPDEDSPEGGYPDFSMAFRQCRDREPSQLLLIYKAVYRA